MSNRAFLELEQRAWGIQIAQVEQAERKARQDLEWRELESQAKAIGRSRSPPPSSKSLTVDRAIEAAKALTAQAEAAQAEAAQAEAAQAEAAQTPVE